MLIVDKMRTITMNKLLKAYAYQKSKITVDFGKEINKATYLPLSQFNCLVHQQAEMLLGLGYTLQIINKKRLI